MSDALFWAKVQKGAPDECWPWLGYKKKSGHGLTWHKGYLMHASRRAWIITRGSAHWNLCVLHTCHNPACCNPDHLYQGTRAHNMKDRFGTWTPKDL